MSSKGASRSIIAVAASTTILAGIAGYVWHLESRAPQLEVYVFDLPGSPAIFIRTPEDIRVLIDGGSNTAIIRYLTEILPFYSRRIDMVIATRPDGKNVTGLIDVLNRYKVDRVITPVGTSSDAVYKTLVSTAEDLGLRPEAMSEGDNLTFDKKVSAGILFPAIPERFVYTKGSVPELILELRYGTISILFAGHATTKIQKYIAAYNIEHQNALVVSQSNAPSNFAKEFLATTSPDLLVYSGQTKASKNKTDTDIGISAENLFNIRETGVVKLTYDGQSLKVGKTI